VQIMNPNSGQATVQDTGHSILIYIPAVAQLFVTCFLSFWLLLWAHGEFTAIKTIATDTDANSNKAFLLVWLCLWTLGGGFAIFALLWQFFGREVIELDQQYLRYRMEVLGIGRTKLFSVAHISNLRYAAPETTVGRHANNNALKPKAIKFDFGKSTHGFGMGLDEAEAKQLIEAMGNKVRALRPD
jgi:hypothetical protein